MLEIALLCAGCHGMSGEGRPQAGYPRIAAQPAAYLERQLEAYADGRRSSVVMEPLARSLTAEERRQLAAHFASIDPEANPSGARRSSAEIDRRTQGEKGAKRRR